MTTDPFEEFEFRPLNEGLGFHRRPEKKAESGSKFEMKSSALPEIEMPMTSRTGTPDLRQPLRRQPAEETRQPDSGSTVDEILKTLQSRRKMDFDESVRTEPPAQAYRISAHDISSFILDGMLVTAATLACLIILLMVTKVDLFGVVTQAGDEVVYLALFSLYAGIAWIYLVMNRVFLGYTPGEWVFDQRVGLPQEHGTALYSLRVVARTTLVVATGLVPLPLLSVLIRKDLAGMITGAGLLKKV